MNSESDLKEEKHHQQLSVCTTRPPYRQGRKLTAIKTYTVALESQHLFVYGVPSINLRSELKSLCIKYGQIQNIHVAQEYKTEQFTECFHVQYNRIQSARIAKRLLDNKSFYGGVLHVCYAPEFESIEETRMKLIQRRKEVQERLQEHFPSQLTTPIHIQDFISISKSQLKKQKRKTTKRVEEWINEDDPLEPTNKRFKETIQYGPTTTKEVSVVPNQSVEKGEETLKLIPRQVVKQPQKQIKRIVFHKKCKS